MSTLERGNEIEADFYQLKAQEWAMEPYEAKRLIIAALEPLIKFAIERRKDNENPEA